MSNICKGTKKDGAPCGAQSVKGERYCFYHNPEKPEPRQVQRAKPLSEEDIEALLAKLRGETVLPDYQVKKIVDMVSEKLGKEIQDLKKKLDALPAKLRR